MTWTGEVVAAKTAAAEAAHILERSFRIDAGIQSENGRDVKTTADLAAERCIRAHLGATRIPILAEESAGAAPAFGGPGLRWIVDPLDGTFNFCRGFPLCAISIALWDGTRPLIGVVHDLASGDVHTGVVGLGAFRNDTPVKVSETTETANAVLACGFPTNRDYSTAGLSRFILGVQAFKKIRMIGSAALSLAFVAGGAFDAYAEEEIMIWDVAAGLALVKAAGGAIQYSPGLTTNAFSVIATNGRLGRLPDLVGIEEVRR
jgi:myo-inositol-1(or 4)-monophosphatase